METFALKPCFIKSETFTFVFCKIECDLIDRIPFNDSQVLRKIFLLSCNNTVRA